MNNDITVYGTDWCGDTTATRRHLDSAGVEYNYVNIDEDETAEKKVIEFNKGKRRVPLVEISSERGTRHLSVPSSAELDKELEA
jgi:glutaredoxin